MRVPISTPRFSPSALARNLWRFATGGLSAGSKQTDAMTFAPLKVRASGASWVFDTAGMRLEGYRLTVSLAWVELARADLELQSSSSLGLEALRVAVWPLDPAAFGAAHPEARALWDDTIGTWSAVLGKGPTISQTTIDLALAGLAHAGPRFSGALTRSGT